MKISSEKKGNIMFLAVDGNLDFNTHKDLETFLEEVLDEGEKNLIFDLSSLQYLSSCGLRVFLLYLRKVKTLGGKMVLFGLSELVFEIFSVTGFSNIIRICKTEAEALNEFIDS